MKTLLASIMVLIGSTIGAMAFESYGDYRDYFESKPIAVKRAPSGGSKKTRPIDLATDLGAVRRPADGNRSETSGYDTGSRLIADVRPRNWDGGYVPLQPRGAGPGGFWGSIDYSHAGREMNQQSFEGRGQRRRDW